MTSTSTTSLRHAVLATYKHLLHLGQAYPHPRNLPDPAGYLWFRERLHRAFASQRHLTDPAAIQQGIERAQYVGKEIEALYYLKRYRALKKRYED